MEEKQQRKLAYRFRDIIRGRLNGFEGDCPCPEDAPEGECGITVKASVHIADEDVDKDNYPKRRASLLKMIEDGKCRDVIFNPLRDGTGSTPTGRGGGRPYHPPMELPPGDSTPLPDPRPGRGPVTRTFEHVVLHEAGHALGHIEVGAGAMPAGSGTEGPVDGHGLPIGSDGHTPLSLDEDGFWGGESGKFGGGLMSPGWESVFPPPGDPLYSTDDVCQILGGLQMCPYWCCVLSPAPTAMMMNTWSGAQGAGNNNVLDILTKQYVNSTVFAASVVNGHPSEFGWHGDSSRKDHRQEW